MAEGGDPAESGLHFENALPAGPAYRDPATKRAVNRYRLHAAAMLGLGAVVLGVWLGMLIRQLSTASWLAHHGARTNAVVLSRSIGRTSNSVTVGFLPHGSPALAQAALQSATGLQQATIHTPWTSHDYIVGDTVGVLYDPGDPSVARTLDDANLPSLEVPWLLVAILGAGLLIAGVGALSLGRRFRHALTEQPWHEARARPAAARRGRRRSARLLLDVEFEGERAPPPVRVRVESARWRTGRLMLAKEHLWAVRSVESERVVLAIPATRELYGARVVAS